MNKSGVSKSEIEIQILDNYDVTPEECKNDIDKLIEALTNEGLLEEV